jgi:hypothetical protein
VESNGPGQMRAFEAPLAGFIAHISWRSGEGWRVYVTSWAEGQLPTSGHQETYTHLTASEALDVLAAEVATRCDWLRA